MCAVPRYNLRYKEGSNGEEEGLEAVERLAGPFKKLAGPFTNVAVLTMTATTLSVFPAGY